MSDNKNFITFRCKHRHSAVTHPKCYLAYLRQEGELDVRLPKILVFDIETSPLEAYIWQHNVVGAYVPEDRVISEWFMLTWSAKWLYDDTIVSLRLTGREAVNENDKRIVGELWKLFDEAEIVIAHNGNKFDVPNMNTRFIVNGYPPPSPYQTIDTVAIARKQFGFTHNNLNALARVFGFEPKKDTDFALWKSAKNGNEDALKYMEEYNRGDVELLEQIYLKLRPWIKSHPNLGLYLLSDGAVCPNCGSSEITWLKNKFYYTQVGRYPLYVCECGAYGRSRKSDITKEVSKSLTVGLAT